LRSQGKALNESTISALTTVGKKENAEAELGAGNAAPAHAQQPHNGAAASAYYVDDNNFDGGIHDEGWHNDSSSDIVPLRMEFKHSAKKDKQAREPDMAASRDAPGKFIMDDESDIDFDESLEAVASPAGDAFFKSPDRSGRGAPKNRAETVRSRFEQRANDGASPAAVTAFVCACLIWPVAPCP
jgi:hypothetical protein